MNNASPWTLRRASEAKRGNGAVGGGRTWPRSKRRRWSAGRRRTPTSLGCARRRSGARRTLARFARVRIATHPAPPGAPFPSSAREKENGKGRRPAPKNKVTGQRKRWLVGLFDK